MIESIFWGCLLRITQATIQAAPTILVGLLVSGIFRRLLGHEGTRKLFGCGTWRELPQAWLIGMILPVCSLGVIPVAREMRRAGIAGGTVLAFAMTAPLFNPLSMLYGLTLSEPFVIFTFAMAALVVVTAIGSLWDWIFPGSAVAEEAPPPVAYGLRRMASIGVVGAREMGGASLGYILIGLLGVGALAAVLPPGRLMSTMEHSNPWAPLAMTLVAIPAYATPMVAMAQLGSMFQHANSVGAAFALLTLGAGLNLGLLGWMGVSYGFRRVAIWLGILIGVVLALAYTMENPLHPSEIEAPGHTHAFDIYCRPFEAGASGLPAQFAQKIKQDLMPHEKVALYVLGAITAAGFALRKLDPSGNVERWLERQPEPVEGAPRWGDVTLSAPVLGGVALLGIVAFSVVGCYAYYPPPSEVFEEMRILRGEVLTAATSGNVKHATHFIPVWDDWTRRLQVGFLIRGGDLTPYRRMKAKVFRDRIEFLKHAVEDKDKEETREYVARVQKAYYRMKTAFEAP